MLLPGAVAIVAVLVVIGRLTDRPTTPRHERAGVPLGGLLDAAPPAVATGCRLAIGGTAPERRRFRSTAVTAAAALALVLAGIGFVGSLTQLVDEPARYGVGWDLTARNAYGSLDVDAVRAAVVDDPDIVSAASAGLHKVVVDDEQLAPALGVLPISGELWPTVLDGRTPQRDDEVLVGAVLDRLGVDVGDTVRVRSEPVPGAADPPELEVQIVGTAVFPSIDIPGLDPTRLDEGPAMTWDRYQSLIPPDFDPRPDLTFLTLADGVDPQDVIDRFPDGLPQFDRGAPTE